MVLHIGCKWLEFTVVSGVWYVRMHRLVACGIGWNTRIGIERLA